VNKYSDSFFKKRQRAKWQPVTDAEHQTQITDEQSPLVFLQVVGGVRVLMVLAHGRIMEFVPFVKTVQKQLTDGTQ
jgi:hypothetical protein